MRYRLTSWLFVALPLSMPLPVLAQVQVDGQASGFRYALGDLVPGDTVTPEIKLATSWEPGVSGRLRVFDWQGNIRDDDQADSGQGSMVLEQAWGRDLRSRTSYEVDGPSPILGWSIGITPHAEQSIGIDVTSEGPWMTFELSPKTSITFEIDLAMRLSMAPETDTGHWRGTSMAALMLSVQDPETVSF